MIPFQVKPYLQMTGAFFFLTVFPNLHASPLIQHEIVANYSILYTIKGRNSKLTPYLLMAHLDVVPANDSNWDAPPFDAEIKDGFIYARGTIDFKQGVMVSISSKVLCITTPYMVSVVLSDTCSTPGPRITMPP